MQPLITNKNSLYLKRLELHGRIKAINTGDLGLLSIYESVNGNIDEKEIKLFLKAHPEFDIDSINDDYAKLYPLLNHINIYNYSEITAHVAQYVNIIDKV
jgi:hypothetical protein